MSTVAFYSLSNVCQYLTLYRVFVLCHYVHCCLVQSVHCLSVPHTIPSVCSVSLCPLLPSTVCPLSVITSHYTVCLFCVTMSIVAFYSMSTVCQYLTIYRLCSASLCPMLPSTVCPLSVSTSQYTVCLFCVTISTVAFYSLSTVCQYLTVYRLFVLCHYGHCCLLQSVHCLSVPDTVPSVCSVSLCPLLPSTVCPLCVSTSHYTVCWFCVTMPSAVFYILSKVSQYLTLYCLLELCHYILCWFLHFFHCLSVHHTVPPLCSVSLCILLSSKFRSLLFLKNTSIYLFCSGVNLVSRLDRQYVISKKT
jgi:hypothetical protein